VGTVSVLLRIWANDLDVWSVVTDMSIRSRRISRERMHRLTSFLRVRSPITPGEPIVKILGQMAPRIA
jgi:hypothetical protein